MLLVGLCSWGKGQNATVMGILRNYKKIYSEDDFIRMQNRGRSKERKTCNLPESLVTVFANCMRKLKGINPCFSTHWDQDQPIN